MNNTLPGLVILLMLAACQSAQNKPQSPDATTVSVDSARTSNIKKHMDDPDPSDTVPAEKYNVRSISAATAALVKQSLLNDVFKTDVPAMSAADRSFCFEEIDLNGDGRNEIFVGFKGSYYCGSGGCTALLLHHSGKLITRFTVAEYPIIVDSNKTNEWKNLLIGSASVRPAIHVVKWDGKKYPGNPSIQPRFMGIPGHHLDRVLNYRLTPHPWFDF